MNNKTYNKIVEKVTGNTKTKQEVYSNYFVSFFIGGLIGMFGEWLTEMYCLSFHISRNIGIIYMMITLIFIASILTGLGIFDKLITKAKCGLLIPITGFAHSMTSAALDSKSEGLIQGIGSNIFKLAGSVIVYGVVSAWFFGIVRLLIGGLS